MGGEVYMALPVVEVEWMLGACLGQAGCCKI